MEGKNIVITMLVAILIILLGYFLFFQDSNTSDSSGYYGNLPSSVQQPDPAGSQKTPSGILQPNQPNNLQDQSTETSSTGDNITVQ